MAHLSLSLSLQELTLSRIYLTIQHFVKLHQRRIQVSHISSPSINCFGHWFHLSKCFINWDLNKKGNFCRFSFTFLFSSIFSLMFLGIFFQCTVLAIVFPGKTFPVLIEHAQFWFLHFHWILKFVLDLNLFYCISQTIICRDPTGRLNNLVFSAY